MFACDNLFNHVITFSNIIRFKNIISFRIHYQDVAPNFISKSSLVLDFLHERENPENMFHFVHFGDQLRTVKKKRARIALSATCYLYYVMQWRLQSAGTIVIRAAH